MNAGRKVISFMAGSESGLKMSALHKNLTITIKKAISKMFLNVTAVFMMGK